MNSARLVRLLVACLLVTAVAAPALATVPTLMNYQGRLTDGSPQQNPLDGTVAIEFRIYGSPVGNDLLWTESWPAVQVTGGIFNVLLGNNGTPLTAVLFDEPVRYLELDVNGEILSPRQRLATVAYAFQAERLAKICADGQVLVYDQNEWKCGDLPVCPVGSSTNCYSGPPATAGVGECRAGVSSCDADGTGYGACLGQVLPTAEICSNGLDEDCDGVPDGTCPCPGGQLNCGGSCIDPFTDPANCGACGNLCPIGSVCQGGTCACPAGQTQCAGGCVDTGSDPQNCGACGNVCPGGQTCGSGSCTAFSLFGGIVSNQADPTQPGVGLQSVWSYAGQLGVQAGDLMCNAIGADHICTYSEVEQARGNNELGQLLALDGSTFWVHRTSAVVDVGGVQSPPGAGGRCQDWSYATNHISDGEYARVADASISYFFDQDTAFSGDPADGHAGSGPNDGGQCGGASPRLLLCCNDAGCPAGQQDCGSGCTDTNSDPMNCGACGNVCSGGATCESGQCVGGALFAGLVTNANDPTQPGAGLTSVWSYAGLLGTQAGDAMCGAIGGDHVCTYQEFQQADARGELTELRTMIDTTLWVHRVVEVVDVGGVQSPPGAGARCNDWTYPTNHIADGEYLQVTASGYAFFFDQNPCYTGDPADGCAGSGPNDGGQCGGASPRAIACCYPIGP